MKYTTVAKTGFITSLYIVLVPVLSVPLGNRPKFKSWICVILATVGLYFLSMTTIEMFSIGDILVLISAFCYAVQILVIDYFSRGIDGIIFTLIQFITSTFLAGVLAIATEHPTINTFSSIIAPVLFAGIFSCGIADTLQVLGQQNTNPVIATLILSLESVFSLIGGILILKQKPSIKELFGGLLIFIAVIVTQIKFKTNRDMDEKPCQDR